MKFDTVFRKSVEKIQVLLNMTRITGTLREDIYDNLVDYSWNEKCFRQKLWWKSKHTFYVE